MHRYRESILHMKLEYNVKLDEGHRVGNSMPQPSVLLSGYMREGGWVAWNAEGLPEPVGLMAHSHQTITGISRKNHPQTPDSHVIELLCIQHSRSQALSHSSHFLHSSRQEEARALTLGQIRNSRKQVSYMSQEGKFLLLQGLLVYKMLPQVSLPAVLCKEH